MARNAKEPKIPLKQADRSGPVPSQKTLLDLAEARGLLNPPITKDVHVAQAAQTGRWAESLLWSFSLSTGLFTLDVLVASQYAVETDWPELVWRTFQAFPIILILFYLFHPHPSPPVLLPRLPASIQPILHQSLFFTAAVAAGTYLIYLTNTFSYYAVLKQAPPVGIIWIWSVIELDLTLAMISLACCGIFLKLGGYSLT